MSTYQKSIGKEKALAAEVESLRADKERLDWLDGMTARLNAHYKTEYGWELITNHLVTRLMVNTPHNGMAIDLNDARGGNGQFKQVRAAIDAARADAARKEQP